MKMIYVDTSVIIACYDTRFKKECLALMALFEKGVAKMIYSETTKEEVKTKQHTRKKVEEIPEDNIIYVETTPEIRKLADTYISNEALTLNHEKDALHIATATVYNADIVISRNFKQMVNKNKKEKYNLINVKLGYKEIEIMSPGKFLQINKL